jgi:DNA-directed RNA polymerase subunit N (RpoN/RPB10)
MIFECYIKKLTDGEKAKLAKKIVDMIGDDELALQVLSNRCFYCGKKINTHETCYCTRDD